MANLAYIDLAILLQKVAVLIALKRRMAHRSSTVSVVHVNMKDTTGLYTQLSPVSCPKVCQAWAKSAMRRRPIQMDWGPGGRSPLRLL